MAVELLAGEPKEGESSNAIVACNDYLRMGLARSLTKLVARYQNATEPIPTKRIATLKTWSVDYGWQERATEYDKAIDAEKTAANDVRRKVIMEQGLSQDFERVNELYEIFDKLKLELVTKGLYYTDIKLSSKGDEVEVEVFNKALIDSLRGVLDDLAKETGGRRQKTEISGADGGPIKHEVEHAIDGDTATTIFDILARAGALESGVDDAQDDGVHSAQAD